MPLFPLRRFVVCLLALVLLPTGASLAGEDDAAQEQAALNRLIAELRPLVSELRGLEWKHDVPAEVLSRDALQALLEKQLAEEVTDEELERDTRITRRLGLIGPDENLLDLMLMMMREMVAGAYDPKSKKLYLIQGFSGEAQKPTLVHELIHALDDQHYDLRERERPYEESDPDRHFALRAVTEGSAECARRLYQDRAPGAALAFYEQMATNKEMQAGQQRVMKAVPTHLLLSALMHYRVGPNFVTRAVGTDYVGGMRRLMDDPPTTQEHLLHPYKWLGPQRDYPRRVVWGADFAAVGGPRWKTLDEHTVGELDFAVYLDHFLGDLKGHLNTKTMGQGKFVSAMASRAARGWDGGRVTYLERDDGHITILAGYAFDTERDAAEAAEILGAALRKANGKAWLGVGWKRDEGDEASTSARRYFDYAGRYGYGSIRQRGREVLLVDGAPADLFVSILPAMEQTRFAQDPRDRGDDMADPFAGCAVVDRQRGLGLKLADPTWSAEASDDSPYAFANATDGTVTIRYLVVDDETSRAGLPRLGKMVLGAGFRAEAARPAQVMGTTGLVHPLPARPGQEGRIYLGSDTARTYIVIVVAPPAAWTSSGAQIQALLDGEPGARAQGGDVAAAVGLRSIPGY